MEYILPTQLHVPYSGKISREKTFANFTVFMLYTKVSPRNLGRGVLWRCKSDQSTKVFSAKIVISPIHEKFFPSKVSRYTVYACKLQLH